MARMFYTLEEAAEKLGVTENRIKELATDPANKLQQFKDGNRLMYKRDQVDSLADDAAPDDEISLEESGGPIPLTGGDDTDQIDLAEASGDGEEDSRQISGTGISVFDADEVEHADPMAKTQVTDAATDEEELALEGVGSGSGLLDLTKEGDDTSLGAELLEEIYPGGEGSDTKLESLSGSGIAELDTGMGMEGGGSAMGMDNIDAAQPASTPALGGAVYDDDYDPGGNGMSIGMLLATTVVLFIAIIVGISALFDVPSGVTETFAKDSSSLYMYCGIMAGGAVLFGIVGMFVGKALLK